MRRTPAIVFLCIGVALMGAARPAAKPTATPLPTATAAPHRAAPLVIVFAFDTSTDLKAGTGESAAQVFTRQMNADGGLDTIESPGTVKRADFLKYATSVNAAYYVSGYMTPLGNGVSLVEQVVSTRSGTIVFGQTAQIESIQDATAQATLIHDGIVARERQLTEGYDSAQAQATSAPASSNEANLGKGIAGIAGLFHHKAVATPVPISKKPSKGVFVAHVGGALPANDLSRATDTLYDALNTRYIVRKTAAAGETLAKYADSICGPDRNNTIATGIVSARTERRGLTGSSTKYTFVLQIYTCFGAKLAEGAATGDSLTSAVRKAVDNYAADHPGNV